MTPSSVILVDGTCNLCNGAVTWILARDHRARYRFASLTSAAARTTLRAAGRDPEDLPDSMVLVDSRGVHLRSDAALRIAGGLGLPWSLLGAGRIVPRPLRDAIYDWIARNRYRWFGRRDACLAPTPELRSRFLDADEITPASSPSNARRP